MIRDEFDEEWDLNCGRCGSFQVSYCKLFARKTERHECCTSFLLAQSPNGKLAAQCGNCVNYAPFFCHTLKINLKGSAGVCSEGIFRKQ